MLHEPVYVREQGEQNTTLYRAIGKAELEDVLRYGDFGFAPSGGGKYFAFTERGVRNFANMGFNANAGLTITSIQVPRVLLQLGMQFVDVGGAGPAIHFADDVLPNLYQSIALPTLIEVPGIPRLFP